MLNRLASLLMSTSVLKALPDKLDIKRHSTSILCLPPLKLLKICTKKSIYDHSHKKDACVIKKTQFENKRSLVHDIDFVL